MWILWTLSEQLVLFESAWVFRGALKRSLTGEVLALRLDSLVGTGPVVQIDARFKLTNYVSSSFVCLRTI